MEVIHTILEEIVNYAILFFEFIGVFVIIISGIRGAINLFNKDPRTKLYLAQGMSIGLEFKLGSEILRTVIVREWSEIAIVAGIILLRAALTFLIHWGIKCEENEIEREKRIEKEIEMEFQKKFEVDKELLIEN
ncbi:hypothetical protein SDC9_59559 [bioreactor metagenome]|uniref:DUF1622 domain-containing protein n=1 Tax=bioreactor metagenome TaxID=1076179 RepID=A0A644XGG2_9ZZZZ